MTINLKDSPEVKAVVRAAFPSYRKLKASVQAFYPMTVNSYWDGGSKDEFAIVELLTLQRRDLPTSSHPYFDVERRGLSSTENEHVSVDRVGNVTLKHLPDGFALVRAGTFCGKPATAAVYVPDSNLTKLLEKGRS